MKSAKWLVVPCVGVALFGIATATLAQSRVQSKSHKEIVKLMEDKKMSLPDAIEKAEAAVKGGKAVGARAEVTDGDLSFNVQVSSGDDLRIAHVDSKGKVTLTEGRRGREEGGKEKDKKDGEAGGGTEKPRSPRSPKP